MKLSLEWLRNYVDLPACTPEEVAHKLTMVTAEVENVDILERSVEGIRIGEITAVKPIDTGHSDKLMQYVTVKLGSETCQTVCGAPNVTIGMKSAFAAPGITIAEGMVVREQEVYGCLSKGILCSPRELGWGESHVGIMAFPDSLAIGTELADLVPPVDHILDVDNKTITHRPDLWGHYGFARELAAIYNCDLKPLETADASAWDDRDPFPLVVEDYENCPGYCCLDIDGLKVAYSPVQIQYLLLAIGLRPINLLVDLTNFIMCELGQPMHAFDGERVRDVIVRPFGKKGTFRTLDSVDREMIPDDLMICDHGGPIALAGIMGGEDTEIKDDTSRILLESANFNPARIRRTSLRLNLRSDASMRFEKGQPPYHMGLSIKRLVHLLNDAGQNTRIRSSLTCAGDTGEKVRTLTMSTDMINRFIGMNIPDDTIVSILASLGFRCDRQEGNIEVHIPPYRSVRDVSIPNDIIEEVARLYGYDNIVPAMPEIEIQSYVFNTQLLKQHKIRRFLSAAKGFNEIHAYSWYDDNWLKRIRYDPEETLTIQNPPAANNTLMRLELLANLLMLVEPNAMFRDRFSLYEVGNVYHPSADGCEQKNAIAGVVFQSEKSGSLQDLFPWVKGVVEELFTLTNAGDPVFSESEQTRKPWEAPGASMDIELHGTRVGTMGYLNEKTFPAFEKDTQVVWFELNLGAMSGTIYPVVDYETIPIYPGSWMDFSILASSSSNYDSLASILEEFSHPILKTSRFLYLYDGKGLPEGKTSYTFRFRLGIPERTLNGEDLSDFHLSFLQFLEKHGLSLR